MRSCCTSPGRNADTAHLVAAVSVGVVSAGAYLLYNAVGGVPVVLAGMALTLIPLFGVAAARTFLGERIGTSEVVGGVLILAGLAVLPIAAERQRQNDLETRAAARDAVD